MMNGMVSRWDKLATFVSLQILQSIDLQRLTLLVLLECVPVCEAFTPFLFNATHMTINLASRWWCVLLMQYLLFI